MGGMTNQKWEIDKLGHVWGVDSEGQKHVVAETSCYIETGKDFLCSECMANMRLVSKAPEMLKMLKTVQSNKFGGITYLGRTGFDEIKNLIDEIEGAE